MSEYYGYYSYPEDYLFGSQSMLAGMAEGLMSFVFIICFFVVLYSIAAYLFNGIGLYTIAKKRGMSNPFFAFVPYCDAYYLGAIADDIDNTMNKRSNYGIRLLVLYMINNTLITCIAPFVLIASSMEMYVVMLFAALALMVSYAVMLCFIVYRFIVLHKIYKEYAPTTAVTLLVLSILFNISPFVIFAIRNKKSGYQLWCEQQEREKAKAEHPEKFMDGYTNRDTEPEEIAEDDFSDASETSSETASAEQ